MPIFSPFFFFLKFSVSFFLFLLFLSDRVPPPRACFILFNININFVDADKVKTKILFLKKTTFETNIAELSPLILLRLWMRGRTPLNETYARSRARLKNVNHLQSTSVCPTPTTVTTMRMKFTKKMSDFLKSENVYLLHNLHIWFY